MTTGYLDGGPDAQVRLNYGGGSAGVLQVVDSGSGGANRFQVDSMGVVTLFGPLARGAEIELNRMGTTTGDIALFRTGGPPVTRLTVNYDSSGGGLTNLIVPDSGNFEADDNIFLKFDAAGTGSSVLEVKTGSAGGVAVRVKATSGVVEFQDPAVASVQGLIDPLDGLDDCSISLGEATDTRGKVVVHADRGSAPRCGVLVLEHEDGTLGYFWLGDDGEGNYQLHGRRGDPGTMETSGAAIGPSLPT